MRKRISALAAAALVVGIAAFGGAPAQAAVDESPVALKIELLSGDAGFKAGDPISFRFTATNDHDTAVTFPERARIMATYETKYEDPDYHEWSGDCGAGGFGDYGSFVVLEGEMVLPDSLAPGASLTCVLTYPASATDVANGGLWTRFYYESDWQNFGNWSPGWWWGTLSTSATKPMLAVSGDRHVVGSPLTAELGYWGIWDDSFTYQWLRDGEPITDATTSEYVVTPVDVDHAITVRVKGTSAEDESSIPYTSKLTSTEPTGDVPSPSPLPDPVPAPAPAAAPAEVASPPAQQTATSTSSETPTVTPTPVAPKDVRSVSTAKKAAVRIARIPAVTVGAARKRVIITATLKVTGKPIGAATGARVKVTAGKKTIGTGTVGKHGAIRVVIKAKALKHGVNHLKLHYLGGASTIAAKAVPVTVRIR